MALIEFVAFGMLGLAAVLNQRALSLTLRMGPEFYEANPIARAYLGHRKLRIAVPIAVYAWLVFITWLLSSTPLPFRLLFPASVLVIFTLDWLNDEWQSRKP